MSAGRFDRIPRSSSNYVTFWLDSHAIFFCDGVASEHTDDWTNVRTNAISLKGAEPYQKVKIVCWKRNKIPQDDDKCKTNNFQFLFPIFSNEVEQNWGSQMHSLVLWCSGTRAGPGLQLFVTLPAGVAF